jgi:hypothetical protein
MELKRWSLGASSKSLVRSYLENAFKRLDHFLKDHTAPPGCREYRRSPRRALQPSLAAMLTAHSFESTILGVSMFMSYHSQSENLLGASFKALFEFRQYRRRQVLGIRGPQSLKSPLAALPSILESRHSHYISSTLQNKECSQKTRPYSFQDGYTATAKIRELEAEYLHSPSISPSGPAHGSEEADSGSRRRDGSVRANNRLWRHGSAGVRRSHELEKELSGSLESLPSWYSRVPIIALTAGEEVG